MKVNQTMAIVHTAAGEMYQVLNEAGQRCWLCCYRTPHGIAEIYMEEGRTTFTFVWRGKVWRRVLDRTTGERGAKQLCSVFVAEVVGEGV